MWETLVNLFLAFIDSPTGVACALGAFVFFCNLLAKINPLYESYLGTIESAVLEAQKMFPNGCGSDKLRIALDAAAKAFKARRGRAPTAKELGQLQEGVNLTVTQLKRDGLV